MSLAAYHQAIRQRTWDQAVESIYDAVERKQYKLPPKVANSAYAQKYEDQVNRMFDLYWRLLEEGVDRSEAIGVISHALILYDLIHVNGWNAIHSIGKRTCTEAQWEIRAVATEMAKLIKQRNSTLGTIVGPQGQLYGRCPERKPCGACEGISNPPEKKPAA
jgi:thymidylate synthase (FAD)